MYQKAYGIIETLAPLHVGASAGEETGNLNLIFRDQFTQTGIIPGSSIRGRFRADMRLAQPNGSALANLWYGHSSEADESDRSEENKEDSSKKDWTTEALVKIEYASLLWIPVYCPNQPIVRVSSPLLLRRYQRLANLPPKTFTPYSYYGQKSSQNLFFNLGFLPLITEDKDLANYIPSEVSDATDYLLLVVENTEISMIHDMALYRQSRVSLEPNSKKAKKGAFFDVEALPESSVLVFPLALRKTLEDQPILWEDFTTDQDIKSGKELYFGGLESIGFGRTQVFLKQTIMP